MEQPMEYKDRVWYAAKVALFLVALASVLYFASSLIFLVFAGILFAVFLSGLSHALQEKIPLPYGWCLFLVCFVLLSLFSLGAYFIAPSISQQMEELGRTLPSLLNNLRERVSNSSWGNYLLSGTGSEPASGRTSQILTQATGALSGALGLITTGAIIFFLGLYSSAEPSTYRRGFLSLVPPSRRGRAAEVLSTLYDTLRWWLIGKFVSMAIIGVLTTLGLSILGVPMPLALGLIAAVLTFIPNIGPILSAIPAVLLGFMEGPQQALLILLLYLVIQVIESYMITPLIQRKAVSLPPGLSLTAQVLLGMTVGLIGVAVAVPFTAAAMVLVQMLYIEDTLGDEAGAR